jgi:hypothetical protein
VYFIPTTPPAPMFVGIFKLGGAIGISTVEELLVLVED